MLFALFPIGDDNSDRRTVPYVTYALLALNIAVFVLLQVPSRSFTYGYSVVPFEIAHNVDLPDSPGPQPVLLTILSAMFMHGSWAHLGGNMLYLWIFGDNVEDAMGHAKFAVFYLLCGVLATLAHVLSGPNSLVPSLGASGAIAGVLGGYILLYPSRRVRVLIGWFGLMEVPAFLVIGLWAGLQFFNGFGSIAPGTEQGKGGVAYMAHVGGFVAGLLLVKLFAGRGARQKVAARYEYPMEGFYEPQPHDERRGGPFG